MALKCPHPDCDTELQPGETACPKHSKKPKKLPAPRRRPPARRSQRSSRRR